MATTNKNKKSKSGHIKPAANKLSGYKPSALPRLLFIVAITFIAYYPSLKNQFTGWDDGGYVVENLDLKNFSLPGIKYQFTQYVMGNYHPLTMISLSMDYAISKLNPTAYHWTNLICHLINTLLVFRLILLLLTTRKEITNKTALMAATIAGMLFGIHTLGVESVAWVSERKNLLYTMFFLGALILYINYIQLNKIKYYLLSIFLFILSLLSKGTAVSLALTLPLIDYYYGRKLLNRRVIVEKLPFFLLALIFGIIAVLAQKSSNTIQSNEHYYFYERLLFAGYGFFQYLLRFLLPVRLSFFYNYPTKVNGLLPMVYYLYPLLSLIILGVIAFYYRHSKIIMFSVLFFIINIILVLQIIPVGYAVMADRYAYLPSVGFVLIPAVIYKYIKEQKPAFNNIYIILIIIYSITLINLTQERCKSWHDGITLWDTEIEDHPGSALAFKGRGKLKLENNDNKGAYDDFDKAIQLNPGYGEAYNGRGMARGKMEDYKGAIEDLDKAITFYPNDQLSWNNRGIAKSILNDLPGAITDFNEAIRLDPKFYNAYYNRALAESAKNDHESALKDLDITIKINPDYIDAYTNRGIEKLSVKDYEGAIKDFDITIESQKDNARVYFNRGLAKYNLNDKAGSCEDFKTSFSLGNAKAGEMLNAYCK